ncbi:anthranilate phosphoribosyltransferase [Alkalibacillus haloalkaliphilus]|uniref:Anthranilate phosphoribosyltransferase n=1 Tax=Alkalibacillus haloalkaliphilus TaxID=94136 RepID=A0A511W4P0_9BACI|nr:anthranilate phosphoribosyltransferase [Alkalibacillus haloalkaliphilus]GEN46030.1 anthranilate phosphoribosyltransferase [Alkalibacillus haloalkaliphilus]
MKLLQKLVEGNRLTQQEMTSVAHHLFSEEISDSEIASVLTALKVRGESVEEIAAIVEVLREKAMPIKKDLNGVMDNCGTGGDGLQTFNISTTSAFVLAGAGAKVAKHGNRSVSSRTGSADVLEELGVALDFTSDEVEQLIETNGVAFLFAPYVHHRLKRIMKVRKDLNVPTIFNLIGPLTNPVALDTQFLGVYRRDQLMKMAAVLQRLGRKRSIVVNGAGYMDEASLAGENHFVLLEEGELIPFTLTPEDVGLNTYSNTDITGGDAKENAQILRDVLSGKEGAYYETTLFNAGIGLFSSGIANSIQEGVALARETIQSGRALEKLNHLINYSEKRNVKEIS